MLFQRIGVLQSIVGLIGIAYAVFGVSATVFAQPGFQSRFSASEGILMAPPREVEVLLEDASEAIERKQWSEATLALGMLLGIEEGETGGESGEDYFLFKALGDSPLVEGTVLRRAHELFGSIPEEGQKVVELRYGVRAAQAIDEALQGAQWNTVRELASRFAFTRAGQDAALVLAEKALSEGNSRQAAAGLDRLLQTESARSRYGAALGAMAVAAYQSAGMKGEAQRALATTRQHFVSVSMDWNGKKIGWNDKTAEDAILQSLVDQPVTLVSRLVTHPAYPGGVATRNADTKAGLPLPILRWVVELHESFQHKDNLDRTLRKQIAARQSQLIPSRTPISVGSLVITPTYDQRILAIDARSGRILWPCVFSGMPLGFSLDRFAGKDGFSLGLPAPDYLVRRVWGEMAVGQIASDGERLFSLSEMPAVDVAESFAQGPNARLARNLGVKTYNVMQSWSIQDQGKLLWECGGPTGLSSPELAGALFLGAPLPHEGELLSIAEINGEIFLLGIANETGKLRWRQPIAANQGTTISIDPQRRSFGASPAVDGSIVVCPTLSGFLIAYDLAARELLWQFKYPLNATQMPGAAFNFVGGMDLRESNPMAPRSVDTSLILQDGVALFGPPNGNAVFGISLMDGKELWQVGFDDPSPLRYVAGAWNQVAVIVQSNAIVGVDLRTGQKAWPNVAFPGGAQVVGRGVRAGNRYYVPLSNQSLLEVDLERGVIVAEAKAEKPLGNLIVVGDRLVSASPFQLDCYSIRDAFQKRLLDELKVEGESARTLVQQGEMAMAAGELDDSLGSLERAYALEPKNADVRLALVKVATMALKKDFDRYVDRVQKYQELTLDLDLPSYLRIMIHGLEKQQQWEEMFVKLVELSDARLNRRIDQMSDGEEVDLNSQWTVQEDRWISTRVERCAEKIPESAWTRLEPMVTSRLDPDRNRDQGLRRLRLEHFQGLKGSEAERLRSAESLGRSSWIEAERLLQYRRDPEETLSSERKLALAELYLKAGRAFQALEFAGGTAAQLQPILTKVLQDSKPYAIRNEVDGGQLARLAEIAAQSRQVHDWPTGTVDVKTEFNPNTGLRQFESVSDASNLCPIVELTGDAFRDWQVFYTAGSFQFVNSITGEMFQQMIDTGVMDRGVVPRIYAIDSLILVELKNQLVAIDTLQANTSQQDGQLWRTAFGDESAEVERGRARVVSIERNVWGLPVQRKAFRIAAAARSGVVVLNNDELSCLDLLTGSRVWAATGYRNASFIRRGETLYIYNPVQEQIVAMDLRDGMVLTTRDADQGGWVPLMKVGGRWLFSPPRTGNGDRSEMKLRLVDPESGETLLEREHTPDTRLALVEEKGVVAIRTDGNMVYWNIEKGVESTYQVDVEGKFGVVTAQVFGDTALILPHAGSMELEKIVVNPSQRSDPSVASCAGRLFAISVEDGKPLWARSQRVRHFLFPLRQNRQSPAAVFLRRLSLSKVRGLELDFASVALVDIKTGRLLYQKHDMLAMRGEAFMQRLQASENMMQLKYLGNTITIRWTGDEAGLAAADQVDEIGELDSTAFRKAAEAMVDEINAKEGRGDQPVPSVGDDESK
jgi:outer membrane protein assembly factor BamB